MTTKQLHGLVACEPPTLAQPEHIQTMTSYGILVDVRMADLMEGLWNAGRVTDCSCQGTDERPAFVSFANLDDAVAFFKQVVSVTSVEDTALVHMLDHSYTEPSWKVFFAVEDLSAVTDVVSAV